MARRRRDTEEVRERREPDAPPPPLQQAPGQRGGTERRLGEPVALHALQLALEKPPVELRVVRDEQVVPGKGQEAAHDGPHRRRPPQLRVAQPRQPRDRVGQCDTRVDERLELGHELERLHANGSDLADPALRRRESGRLEVEDDEGRVLQQRVLGRTGKGHGRPRAGDPAVSGGHLLQQRARKPGGDRRRCEQRPRSVDRRERPLLLEQFDEPVESVERELHSSNQSEHTFALQLCSPAGVGRQARIRQRHRTSGF